MLLSGCATSFVRFSPEKKKKCAMILAESILPQYLTAYLLQLHLLQLHLFQYLLNLNKQTHLKAKPCVIFSDLSSWWAVL